MPRRQQFPAACSAGARSGLEPSSDGAPEGHRFRKADVVEPRPLHRGGDLDAAHAAFEPCAETLERFGAGIDTVMPADARRHQRRRASAGAAGVKAACLRRQTASRKDRGEFLVQAPNLVAGRVFLIESAPFTGEVTGRGAIDISVCALRRFRHAWCALRRNGRSADELADAPGARNAAASAGQAAGS